MALLPPLLQWHLMGKGERVKMHTSFPAGLFLSGILAWKECSSPSAQLEQRLPGVPGRRQPLAGADSGHVKGTGMLCTCGTRGAGTPSPAFWTLLTGAVCHRIPASAQGPRPCEQPVQQYLCVPEPQHPRGRGAKPSQQTDGWEWLWQVTTLWR